LEKLFRRTPKGNKQSDPGSAVVESTLQSPSTSNVALPRPLGTPSTGSVTQSKTAWNDEKAESSPETAGLGKEEAQRSSDQPPPDENGRVSKHHRRLDL